MGTRAYSSSCEHFAGLWGVKSSLVQSTTHDPPKTSQETCPVVCLFFSPASASFRIRVSRLLHQMSPPCAASWPRLVLLQSPADVDTGSGSWFCASMTLGRFVRVVRCDAPFLARQIR